MNVSNLDHLNLTVQNLDQSALWYKNLFGFSEVERGKRGSVSWRILRSGDAMLCMYEHPELADPDSNEGQNHKIYHFGLRIKNPADFENRLRRFNVQVEYGGAVRYEHSWSWYLLDPTGYEIEVAHWDDDQVRFSS